MIGMPNSKLLTIAVPAYNAASYLHTCLDSLVRSGDEVEVLVVNDGSKDGTLQVARDYAERYPGIVVAVDQENRNWGGAVNHALELSSTLMIGSIPQSSPRSFLAFACWRNNRRALICTW